LGGRQPWGSWYLEKGSEVYEKNYSPVLRDRGKGAQFVLPIGEPKLHLETKDDPPKGATISQALRQGRGVKIKHKRDAQIDNQASQID